MNNSKDNLADLELSHWVWEAAHVSSFPNVKSVKIFANNIYIKTPGEKQNKVLQSPTSQEKP